MALSLSCELQAQERLQGLPRIQMLRAEESYLLLHGSETNQLFLQPLKLIELDTSKGIFLTLGGEFRSRFEVFANKNYSREDDLYYSQRLNLHASLKVGSRIRLFGELYHGFTSGEERTLEDDHLDLHQGFLEIKILEKASYYLSLRIGRQEIGYGTSRLIGIREGPNIRRSFDMMKVSYQTSQGMVNFIYGKELAYGFDAFDNSSNLLDNNSSNPTIWGAYLQENLIGKPGNLDFYYLGFKSFNSMFNDVSGKEIRHSLGVRSYGKADRFSFNTEFIFQFGKIEKDDILAYNFETDWKYILTKGSWKPTLGLRLDFSSGDARPGDGKVQTFNPMFVNPAIYSLAAVNTPANLTSFHPNLTIYPAERLSIYVDYALFYRTRANDGLYTPPRFLLRESRDTNKKHIGDAFGMQASWEASRNISLDLRATYFIAGDFIEETGDDENILYIAPTISLKF
ncbi:MAG: alginate export family protein [Bacteroidota bacterium]